MEPASGTNLWNFFSNLFKSDSENQQNNNIVEKPISQGNSQGVNINQGNPLTLLKVKEFAKEKFADHEDKDKILSHLDKKLVHIDYEGCLSKGVSPWIHSDGHSTSYSDFREGTYHLSHEVNNFLATLPGVNTKPYTGTILK